MKRPSHFPAGLRAAALSLLAGCQMVGPDFAAPASPWPDFGWSTAKPAPAPSLPVPQPPDPAWWTLLGDPLLSALEARLPDTNPDIRIAALRLAEARAEVGVAAASLGPTANVNASYTRSQQSRDGVLALTSSNPGPTPQTSADGLGGRSGVPNAKLVNPFDLYQYGFDLSWELDLWGHVARSVEQAQAQAQAVAEALHGARIVAAAELARDYIQLRGTQARLTITHANLDSARSSLALTRARAAGGLTNDLDVANAEALAAGIAADIPAQERQRDALINAIALLLGAPPGAMRGELAQTGPIPALPPRLPIGAPADLLRRRPDLREAEASLHAATAALGVATAELYPRVILSGSGAIQGVQLRNLGDWMAQTYAIGPAVTLPIFDGGRLRGVVAVRDLQQQQAALAWRTRLLAALHEVDDALTDYQTQQQRHAQLQAAAAAARRALAIARDRYALGVADFLQVLTAQRTQFAAEQDLAVSAETQATNLVRIYKALGGGWDLGGWDLD